MSRQTAIAALCWASLFSACANADERRFDDSHSTAWSFGGHTKYQYIHTRIPGNSVFQSISGDSLQDHYLDVRLKLSARRGRLDFNAHAQFVGAHADTLSAYGHLPQAIFPGTGMLNDDRRWFNLTSKISRKGKNAALMRLDRFNIGYTADKTVIRFGRQAISWGNGLLFTPMDILNPFDPATVDKEYKTGDDMLYAQYLLDNGNDLQATGVVRRNPVNGDIEREQVSLALKYHGFWGSNEYDLLLAEHYGDALLGLGFSTDLGGAVLRGDLVWTDTDTENVLAAVAGASYSGVMASHNWTGVIEYHYNGFGQAGSDYSAAALAANPELLKRLTRGELYNLGRHYLGVSLTLEATPLIRLTPNFFINLTDPSALAQLVLAYDWKQDIQLLAALSLPIGPNGSEYGGIDSSQAGLYVSSGPALLTQFAWFF